MLDCVVGEDCFAAGISDGIGGAGDLIDLGLGVSGLAWDGPPEAWGLRGVVEGCGWVEGSAGRLEEALSFSGPSC